MEQCRLFKLHVDFPAIVTDCGGNVAKAFNTTLQWDWLRCGCHLIHNVVNAGLESLKNHAANPAQALLQWYRRRWTGRCYCLIIALLHK